MADKFLVETSARHVHVTKEVLAALFGQDAKLTNKKDLSQPGQFASNERIGIVGPKSTLKNVSILGPERSEVQVELSATDARAIGIAAPVRLSGDVAGSPGCKLVGPAGEVEIEQGVIIAKRHIHATKEDASRLGVQNNDTVWVQVQTQGRSLIFGDVVVRVSDSYALAMHIDTDESNAAGCAGKVEGEIIKIS